MLESYYKNLEENQLTYHYPIKSHLHHHPSHPLIRLHVARWQAYQSSTSEPYPCHHLVYVQIRSSPINNMALYQINQPLNKMITILCRNKKTITYEVFLPTISSKLGRRQNCNKLIDLTTSNE